MFYFTAKRGVQKVSLTESPISRGTDASVCRRFLLLDGDGDDHREVEVARIAAVQMLTEGLHPGGRRRGPGGSGAPLAGV